MDGFNREAKVPQPSSSVGFLLLIKGHCVTDEEHALCRRVWRKKNMHPFANFIAWYNYLNVELMLQRQLDVLKGGITLPGLAVL